MENRNWKLKLLGMFSSIGIVFLIFWILVDIFICKIDISDSDSKNTNPKIENEIQDDGRLDGDDVKRPALQEIGTKILITKTKFKF